tara:strand:- start:42 stop:428 length:387 start_codon:yes stop_codon:yes gene_type:complete
MGLFPKDFAKWCTPSRISYIIGFVWAIIGIYYQFRIAKVGGLWGMLLILIYGALLLFGVWYNGLSLDCLCKRGYNALAWIIVSFSIVGAFAMIMVLLTFGATYAALMSSKITNVVKDTAKESFGMMLR